MQAVVDRAVSPRRFVVILLGGFAAFALILASLGIYAVISYSVSQRTSELGIRIALGAKPSSILAMVMKQAGGLIAVGVTVGLAGIGMFVVAGFNLFGKAADPAAPPPDHGQAS